MTNNPTIDGVSRELTITLKITAQQEEDILRFFDTCEDNQGYDVPKPRMKSLARLGVIRSTGFSRYEITGAGDSLIEKLCEPAPVVERQPVGDVVQMASMPVERCYDVRAKMIIAFNEAKKAGGDLDDQLDAAYKAALRFSPAPQDFAALQSTIAQLQAESARIKARLCVCRDCGGQGEVYSGHSSYQGHNQPPEPDMDVCGTCDGDGVLGPIEDFEALASERDLLQARIAELESGSGEPVAWAFVDEKGEHGVTLRWDVAKHLPYFVKPLFTAPPAPVATVLPFEFEHPSSKERRTVALTKRDVFDGMEDYFYDKLGEQICQCESVGETNVVDCNCDEYVHDFEIVNACLDATAALNGGRK
jgi:hypothetical protein